MLKFAKKWSPGRADESERDGLARALELARSGAVKKILVHEVSRIARKSSIVHTFVEAVEDCGVSLYWHAQAIETLLPSGKRNPAAGIMLALLAEMARNEVDILRERILSGLAEAKRKGVTLGRPVGTTLEREAFLQNHRDVIRQLKAGQSVRNTAKITGTGGSTVQRVKAALKICRSSPPSLDSSPNLQGHSEQCGAGEPRPKRPKKV